MAEGDRGSPVLTRTNKIMVSATAFAGTLMIELVDELPASLRPPEVEQRQAADQLHRTSGALQKSFNSASYLLADQFSM